MKKIVFAFFCMALLLTGCADTADKADDGRLTVCTSFYALYDFADKVGGERADVINLVPAGSEPHDWEPSSHDMLRVSKADILFYNGLGMESWIDSVKSSAGGKTKYVCLSDGLCEDGASDPHIWLDPNTAIEMVNKIEAEMSAEDSKNADYYKQNARELISEMRELDKAYAEAFADKEGFGIVVSHEAYGSLCSRYNIEQRALEGIIPQSEPSPEQMKKIIDYINDNNIDCIFYEKLLSKKTVNTVAEETGAELLELDPFEGLTQADIDAGEDYISVMYKNLENLKKAAE